MEQLNKPTLFESVAQYAHIMMQVEDNDGVLTPELEEQLDITEDNLENKLRGYRYMLQMKKSTNELLKDEINNLKGKIEANENFERNLKSRVAYALKLFGENTGKNFKKKYNDFQVYTKDSEVINYNDEAVKDLLSKLDTYPDELNEIAYAEVTVKVPIKDLKLLKFDYMSKDKEVHLGSEIKTKVYKEDISKMLENVKLLQSNEFNNEEKLINYNKIINSLQIEKQNNTTVIFR